MCSSDLYYCDAVAATSLDTKAHMKDELAKLAQIVMENNAALLKHISSLSSKI